MRAALFMLMSGPADATMTPTMTKENVGAEVYKPQTMSN